MYLRLYLWGGIGGRKQWSLYVCVFLPPVSVKALDSANLMPGWKIVTSTLDWSALSYINLDSNNAIVKQEDSHTRHYALAACAGSDEICRPDFIIYGVLYAGQMKPGLRLHIPGLTLQRGNYIVSHLSEHTVSTVQCLTLCRINNTVGVSSWHQLSSTIHMYYRAHHRVNYIIKETSWI